MYTNRSGAHDESSMTLEESSKYFEIEDDNTRILKKVFRMKKHMIYLNHLPLKSKNQVEFLDQHKATHLVLFITNWWW